MTRHPVMLRLPEDLYERIRQVAQEHDAPVEAVLIDSLALMFGGLPTEVQPDQLDILTDEQLWAVVYHQLTWPQKSRLDDLMARNKSGSLSKSEQKELERLVQAVDRYVLLRSKALLLLKQRGHEVETRLKMGA